MTTDLANTYNIGQAAQRAGVSARMVRHYESLGLIPAVVRADSGYRQYSDREVHTLRFIKRGRDLGFGMAAIAELLTLWQNKRRPSAKVKQIALDHVADLQRRITEMASMKRTLAHLAGNCQGNDRPDCPILDDLAAPRPDNR